MADFMLPDVRLKSVAPRLIDATGRFVSPLVGTLRSVARPGDRWGIRVDYENIFGAERGRIESTIANIRGAANRLLVLTSRDYPLRGNFPATELFTNNNFSGGTTNWTTESALTIVSADRVLRSTRLAYDGSSNNATSPKSPAAPLSQYLPYCVRFVVRQGRGTPNGLLVANDVAADGVTGNTGSGAVFQSIASSAWGLVRGVRVPWSSGSYNFGPFNPATTGGLAGDYYDTTWSSCSQCFMVDNGPNFLKFSDTLASPWVPTAASVAANAAMAADGSVSAASITDTTANSAHFVGQNATIASGADDVMACAEFKAGAQNFAYLQIFETVGNTFAIQIFNLSSGTLATGSVGTNWSNLRSFIAPLGNGWYYCCVVAKKTNAATTATLAVGPANVGTTGVYTGAGSVASLVRRVTLSQSSVPQRQVQSSSSAVAALAQSGNAIYVKGLPVSSNGLLLPGDWIEINLEPKRVTAELNSDAAGLGYLMFSPPLRNSPADNDPVLVASPMGRFVASSTDVGWTSVPGPNAVPFANSSIDLVEAP